MKTNHPNQNNLLLTSYRQPVYEYKTFKTPCFMEFMETLPEAVTPLNIFLVQNKPKGPPGTLYPLIL